MKSTLFYTASFLALASSLTVVACTRSNPKKQQESNAPAGSVTQNVAVNNLAVSESFIDFGTVVEGEPVIKQVTITNQGSKRVNIDKLYTNSMAIKMTMQPLELAPGAQGTLEIKHETMDQAGSYERLVEVASTDTSVVPVTIRTKITVDTILAFKSGKRVNPVLGETRGEREYEFFGTKLDEANLAVEKVDAPDVQAKFETRKTEDGKTTKVLVVSTPSDTIGRRVAIVHVSTGIAARPTMPVSVSWTVESHVVAVPGAFVFKSDMPEGQPDQLVKISSDRPGLVVKSAVCDSPVFKPTLKKVDGGKAWEVRLAVVNNEEVPKVSAASVKVVTNDKYQPELTLPIGIFPTYKPYPIPPAKQRQLDELQKKIDARVKAEKAQAAENAQDAAKAQPADKDPQGQPAPAKPAPVQPTR